MNRDAIKAYCQEPALLIPLLLQLKVNSVLLVAEFIDDGDVGDFPTHCYVLRCTHEYDWDIINPGCDSDKLLSGGWQRYLGDALEVHWIVPYLMEEKEGTRIDTEEQKETLQKEILKTQKEVLMASSSRLALNRQAKTKLSDMRMADHLDRLQAKLDSSPAFTISKKRGRPPRNVA